jgi:hypothetical protein
MGKPQNLIDVVCRQLPSERPLAREAYFPDKQILDWLSELRVPSSVIRVKRRG